MTYLGKLGELTLKGSNKQEFENLLIKNTKKCLEGKNVKIKLIAGRLYIDCEKEDCQSVEFTLNHLLGITGWALTSTCDNDIEQIKKTVFTVAQKCAEKGAKTFKIETRRAYNSFLLIPMKLTVKQPVM